MQKTLAILSRHKFCDFSQWVWLTVLDGGDTLGRRHRGEPGHTVIYRRPDAVQVAPRALLATRKILLERRITRRHHTGHGPTLFAERLPRGPEIQQHR